MPKPLHEYMQEVINNPNRTYRDTIDAKVRYMVNECGYTKHDAVKTLIMDHAADAVGYGDTIEVREGITKFNPDYIIACFDYLLEE